MLEAAKSWLLGVLRLPHEPEPPAGDADSLRVFRAAPSFLRYRFVLWGLGQVTALVGLGFAVAGAGVALSRADDGAGCLVAGGLGLVVAFLVGQMALSALAVRLDYELRWYMVTDQSLRIREGVFSVREMTMTFANIQNISISQGPLQRFLGVADLEVQSAGGGGSAASQQGREHRGFQMHTGYFRGVDNAEELRDLMRERLRRARGSGLGDPDDAHDDEAAGSAEEAGETGSAQLAPVLAQLRAEAAALRRAAEARKV